MTAPAQRPARLLSRILWTWLACACAAIMLVPALRRADPLFGCVALWCVLVPVVDLLLLHRARLPQVVARLRPVRGRVIRRRQARSMRGRQSLRARPRALLAALFNP